jgi:DNA end-binding protein Ku
MAIRYYWKGYLKLSLVSCPIGLAPATSSSERIAFRQINKQTGNRLRQQMIDEVTREPVDTADKGRGYEIDKGVFIPVEEDEIEAIQIESKHTVEIDSFVPAAQIDKRYYDSGYYIVPTDTVGVEAVSVIREAMKQKDTEGLARNVLNKRERILALEPFGKGLLGTTLHYAYEVRKPDEMFRDIPDVKVPGEMLKLAEHIIEGKEADFDPELFKDEYEEALIELLRKKQAGFRPPKGKPAPARPSNVVNLMDALRKSVAQDKGVAQGKGAKAKGKPAARTRKAG